MPPMVERLARISSHWLISWLGAVAELCQGLFAWFVSTPLEDELCLSGGVLRGCPGRGLKVEPRATSQLLVR